MLIKRIYKERGIIEIKSDIEQILFNESLSKNIAKEKFLRGSFSLIDKDGQWQKAILWFSDTQIEQLKKWAQLLIGIEYQYIPNEFYWMITIVAYSSETQTYFPGCFMLMTSDSWLEMYNCFQLFN